MTGALLSSLDGAAAGALVLLLWGALDCFFGYRLFKLAVALLGALAGGWLAATAGAAAFGPGPLVFWGGFAAGAVTGAFLAAAVYWVGVFVAGFALGFTVSLALLPVLGDAWLLALALGAGLAAGILALWLQRLLLSAATAWSGALRMALAVAFFAEGLDWEAFLHDPARIPALVESRPWIAIVALAMGAAGFWVQYATPPGHAKKSSPAD